MLHLTLMVFVLGDVLRSVVAVDCPGLPVMDAEFEMITFRNLVASNVGEDPASVTVDILSGPFFTCQVQGTAAGTYQTVSLIVIYDSNQGHNNAVGQFEMVCVEISGNGLWDSVSNSLSTPGVDHTTISLRTDCSDCVTSSPPNENHCQCEFQPLQNTARIINCSFISACNSACNTGLMRCTGTGSGDCCVAFDNGVCSNDLTCSETNFVASEQNNYICCKHTFVSL